jgi:release factor glutamine methyltransferase
LATLGDLVSIGVRRLSLGLHPDRARQDAKALLLYILERNSAWLMAHSEEELPEAEAGRYADLLERRYQGEPIQHITGETEFYGLSFRVTPDVLIPRPETEHLVEKVIELAARFSIPSFPKLRILDIGTGSGAIAIALAHKLPHATVTASELSAPALSIACQNAERHGVSHSIRFLLGDLLAPIAEESFEIVVSNPPYVPSTHRSSLAAEVRDHEPSVALFAGADGLDVYRRLIPAAFSALIPGGFIALEIGYAQSSPIAELLAASGFHRIEFRPDLQGIPRVAFAQRP